MADGSPDPDLLSMRSILLQGLVYAYSQEAKRDTGVHASILQAAQAALRDGKSVVIDADVATARSLRSLGLRASYVFILPPDTTALRNNLLASYGGAEEDAAFAAALAFSERELAAVEKGDEGGGSGLYDHMVTNASESCALEDLSGCLTGAYTAQHVRHRCLSSMHGGAVCCLLFCSHCHSPARSSTL
jgi:guanylate kinase